jgi:hypothetical protein
MADRNAGELKEIRDSKLDLVVGGDPAPGPAGLQGATRKGG